MYVAVFRSSVDVLRSSDMKGGGGATYGGGGGRFQVCIGEKKDTFYFTRWDANAYPTYCVTFFADVSSCRSFRLCISTMHSRKCWDAALDSQVDLNTVAFVMTVEDMESLYSNRDVHNAKAARKLQCIIGQPNSRYFQHLIHNNLLPGCDLTANDVKIVDHIYGCDLRSIKGKTV